MITSPPPASETVKEWMSFGGQQRVLRHDAAATGTPMELSVFVPPGGGAGRPVVVFLSGLTCTWENVTTKGGYQRVAAELGLVVVCPDTSPRGDAVPDDEGYDLGQGAGFYIDATRDPWAEHFRMGSYVEDELPEVIASLGLASDRMGLLGHSMGGHGALTLGLKNPTRWACLSAFAPIVAPSEVPWGTKAFSAYLGEDRSVWRQHDACALLGTHRHPAEILIDQGEADAFLAQQLQTHRFTAAAEAAEQPARIRMHAGYDHSYYTIATFMEDHLRHHAAILGA